jgi:hypothetical protein
VGIEDMSVVSHLQLNKESVRINDDKNKRMKEQEVEIELR